MQPVPPRELYATSRNMQAEAAGWWAGFAQLLRRTGVHDRHAGTPEEHPSYVNENAYSKLVFHFVRVEYLFLSFPNKYNAVRGWEVHAV